MNQDILNQQKLAKAAGFDPGPLDGIWGPKTSTAWANYVASIRKSSTEYTITDGWLDGVKRVPSPNIGGVLKPELLIMHFTSGHQDRSAEWFANPAAKVSAHICINDRGDVTQCVPFNRVAWHANPSSYNGRSSCNSFAVGIELDNYGDLTEKDGEFYFLNKYKVPSNRVVKLKHKNDGVLRPWHTYTDTQIKSAELVSRAICEHYGINDITGHDVVAPSRKVDPGPAFNMASFKKNVIGF